MIGDRADRGSDWDVTYEYDPETESPSEVVVRAVASTTNRGVLSIEPLYRTLEPDAIDAFVGTEERDSAGWLSFSYEGCRVFVDADSVSVAEVDVGE